MRTYYPKISAVIPASAPHPKNTEYKISIGDEVWDVGVSQTVIKVQIMYDGKIAGRKSPSYPAGTDDYKRVSETIEKLVKQYNSSFWK